jgi:hypothetical protein
VKLQFPHNAGDFNWLPLKKGSAAWTYLVSWMSPFRISLFLCSAYLCCEVALTAFVIIFQECST